MTEYVTDTHALIWHLTGDQRLPRVIQEIFEAADLGQNIIWIPGIILIEVIYLVEKSRLPETLIDQVLNLIDPPSANYPLVALDIGVMRALQTIDRKAVPDMPDRIIAASARFLNKPLITKTTAISSVSDLTIIW